MLTFFENPKEHDFLRFLRCCIRFLEHWSAVVSIQCCPSKDAIWTV